MPLALNASSFKTVDDLIEKWDGGGGHQCRLLVGMQRLPPDELPDLMGIAKQQGDLDNQTALRLKKRLAEDFRTPLCFGAPSNTDEGRLRRQQEPHAFRSGQPGRTEAMGAGWLRGGPDLARMTP